MRTRKLSRILSLLLALCLVLGSFSAAFAAPGDYVNQETGKRYVAPTYEGLIEDILAGADVNDFFEELADGKFRNIVAAEEAQLEALVELLTASNVELTPEAIKDFVVNNSDAVNEAIEQAVEAVESVELEIPGEEPGEPDPLEVVSVSAINANTIKVTFNQEVEGLAKADVVVTNVNTADKQYVKSVTLAEDKKSAEIVFYDNLVTKNTYKVVIGEAEKEFDFVIDAVARIEAETLQVVEAEKDTAIEYKVYDANGLDVTANVKNDISFEATIKVDEGKVKLDAGQQGFVYVVYKAGTDEEVKSARITVKAEAPQAVKLLAYTVEESPDFTAEDFEAVTTVQKSDSTKTIKVYVEDQFGNKYSSTENDFRFEVAYESLNKEVALVDRANGQITPLKEGTADVRITIGEFSVVRPIEIVADAKIAALSLEKETIEVSDKIAQSIDVVVKDQYGNKFLPDEDEEMTEKMTATIKSGSNIITLDKNEVLIDGSKATFTIIPVEGKEGTATIEFAVGDVKTTLTVVVKKAGAIDGYTVEGFESKLDLYGENKAGTPQDMTLKVFGVDANGVKVGEALTYAKDDSSDYIVELKGKDADGKDITTKDFVTVSATGAKIAPTTVGTYTVTIKVGTLTVYTGSFEVVNTTPKPVIEQIKSSIKVKRDSDLQEALKDAFKVTKDGKDVTISSFTYVSDNTSVIDNDGIKDVGTATLVITKVKVITEKNDGTDVQEIDVPNLRVNVEVGILTAPPEGQTEFTIELGEELSENEELDINDIKYLAFGLMDEERKAQKVATLNEVKEFIDNEYKVDFKASNIVLELKGNKTLSLSIKGELLSSEDWNKVKQKGGDRTIPYRITVLYKNKANKLVKIAMYEDGKAIFEDIKSN